MCVNRARKLYDSFDFKRRKIHLSHEHTLPSIFDRELPKVDLSLHSLPLSFSEWTDYACDVTAVSAVFGRSTTRDGGSMRGRRSASALVVSTLSRVHAGSGS